jgi:hypothetical protein
MPAKTGHAAGISLLSQFAPLASIVKIRKTVFIFTEQGR